VNITIGLALTSFVLFEERVPAPRRARLSGQVPPVGEFRHGIGAGLLAMYVGVIELFLEFVKPVTLAMRLFATSTAARWRSPSSPR